MDGARFDIAIEAQSIGADATIDQLTRLTDRIEQVDTVATHFDGALAAAKLRLKEASAAAETMAASLTKAEKKYEELERAADKAKQQVEKAAAAGKNTDKLQAAFDKARAAMDAQAVAVDALKEKSEAAKEVQERLKASVKTLTAEQADAASKLKKKAEDEKNAAKKAADEKAAEMEKSAAKSAATQKALAGGAAAAFAMVAAAVVAGTMALAKFAIEAQPAIVARLSMASMVLTQNLKGLVSGVKLDKFTKGIEDIVGMFEKSTSTGKALKLLAETLLQPLFDAAAALAPYIKEMFKGFVYGILLVVLQVLKLRNALFEMIPKEVRTAIMDFIDDNVTLENAFNVGVGIAMVFAAVLGVMALAVVSAGVSIAISLVVPLVGLAAALAVVTLAVTAFAVALALTLLLPLTLLAAAIYAVVYAIENWDEIVESIKTTIAGWASAAGDAAKEIITGIVNSISDGAVKVVDALKGVAGKGVAAFKSALGIASPSKVFELQAGYTVDGYVKGLQAGEGDVSDAMTSMAEGGADVGSSVNTSSSTTTSSKSNVVHIAQLIIGDSPVARENFAEFRRMLSEAFEDVEITFGGGEAPAT